MSARGDDIRDEDAAREGGPAWGNDAARGDEAVREDDTHKEDQAPNTASSRCHSA